MNFCFKLNRFDNQSSFRRSFIYDCRPRFCRSYASTKRKSLSTINSAKTYILLFTCISTRAVHLELTLSLDVHSFLRAFQRFTNRRGLPLLVLSDKVKTFEGAWQEIRNLSRTSEVLSYLKHNRVLWTFIAERAPWWGCFWERLIRRLKKPLKKIISRSSLIYEKLLDWSTLDIVDDNESVSYPLWPSHLIHGRRITVLPSSEHYEIVSTHYSLTKRSRHQLMLLKHFTARWKREYLQGLRV